MKLIWHIIWKDIRSERWALLLWAALFVAQIALGLAVFHRDSMDLGSADANQLANMLLVGMQAVWGYVLVVRHVQADAITGTRMFWLTRPISPGRLLRAKAYGSLLLFGVLPVLLKLPWWLYCGFTASDLLWVTVETLGWQLLLIGPAFLIASLTDDLGRALMWGLLLVAALMAGVLLLQAKFPGARLLLGELNQDHNRVGGLLFTRLWLCGFLLVAGSAVVAAHQFLTRRLLRTVGLAALVAGLMVATARKWPWDCAILFTQINDPEPVPHGADSDFAGVKLNVGPALVLAKDPANIAWERARTWIQQDMEVRGVPEGFAIGSARLWQTWRWPDNPTPVGQSINFYFWTDRELRRILGMPLSQGDPETIRWMEAQYADRRARGLFASSSLLFYWKPQELPKDHLPLTGRVLVGDALVDRLRTQAPDGEARVELEFARPQIVLELPLKPGAVWSGRSHAFRLGPWGGRLEHRADLQLLTARPKVREDGIWSADQMDRDKFRGPRPPESEFMAINRSNNTIGSTSKNSSTNKSGRMVIAGVLMQWNVMNVHSARVIRDGKWVAQDQDWPEHTALVLITTGEMFRVTRELKPGKYELQPAPAEKI